MDFASIRTAYLIGIKGAGMTALAQVLAARGIRVSGSDIPQQFYTDQVLREAGIPFVEGFAAANVPTDVDLVIHSTAYGADHVEVVEAHRLGLTVMTYPEALAGVFNAGKGIAVCGTHGKSTTTAMLGWVLAEAGMDPTVLVGAAVPQFGGNARAGRADLVVVEADEYQNKFHALRPYGIILTSIEYDHPDFFSTTDSYVDAFRAFLRTLPVDGFLVACADDPTIRAVAGAAPCEVVWYGKSRGVPSGLRLQLFGDHNIQNALGVLAAAERLEVPRDVALRALASFQGTRRRFEVVGELEGVRGQHITVIDDYGHHPTEIRVTLTAARERYAGRRILCTFHAHTFTRTIALKDQFATAFVSADRTYVMDIFGSAREQERFSPSREEGEREGVGSIESKNAAYRITSDLVTAISTHSPAIASGSVEQTVDTLLRDVQSGDVVICMGAGENDRVARMLVERLREVQ
ncbi:MAG: UDP-N-acetylmuramate--L-alanine ligase [bacterium]|nr:UDP-N-acetylmuramate--L-alanine ligase [bacterium]